MSTWALIDDVKSYDGKNNRLASSLADNWEYPLDLMFLTPKGAYVDKLNSFRDLPNAHVDVGHPGGHLKDSPSHSEIFLSHAQKFLDFRDRTRRDARK
ncbi:MAG: hypothetical protein HY290_28910 [Planctomycetia bacterium]|nr:hypothetical protein [Planctomycetia bacterium]